MLIPGEIAQSANSAAPSEADREFFRQAVTEIHRLQGAACANGHPELAERFAVLLAECQALCDAGSSAQSPQPPFRGTDPQSVSALEARVRLAASGFDFGALLGDGEPYRDELVQPETALAVPAARPGASPTRLHIIIGGRRSGRILTGSAILIGRRDPNSGALPDLDLWPDTAVSRRHGRIHWEHGTYYLTDLDSTNGTMLNGVRVAAGSAVELRAGDIAALGEMTQLEFL